MLKCLKNRAVCSIINAAAFVAIWMIGALIVNENGMLEGYRPFPDSSFPANETVLPLSFDDASWWALQTITTVGYGDFNMTNGGRWFAIGFIFIVGAYMAVFLSFIDDIWKDLPCFGKCGGKDWSAMKKNFYYFIKYTVILGLAILIGSKILLSTVDGKKILPDYGTAVYVSIVTASTVGYGDQSPWSAFNEKVTDDHAWNFYLSLWLILSWFSFAMWVGAIYGMFSSASWVSERAKSIRDSESMLKRILTTFIILMLFLGISIGVGTGIYYAVECKPQKECKALMQQNSTKPPCSDEHEADACHQGHEAFYFMLHTATTIGYGDYHPSTSQGKTFVSFWIPIAMVFNGMIFAILDVIWEITPDASRTQRRVRGSFKFLIWLLVLLGLLFAGAGASSLSSEAIPNMFPDGLYFAVVTASTVGYGDLSPWGEYTPGGRFLYTIWLLLVWFSFLATWASFYTRLKLVVQPAAEQNRQLGPQEPQDVQLVPLKNNLV